MIIAAAIAMQFLPWMLAPPVIIERILAACVTGMPVIARALIGLEYDVAPKLVEEAKRRRLDVNPRELMVRNIRAAALLRSALLLGCAHVRACMRASALVVHVRMR